MVKVLIDADVILDLLFDREPFSYEAAKVLNLCESGAIQGFVTSITLSNVYYLLRKSAAHEKVIASLKMLVRIVSVVPTDKATVLDALNSEFRDFEDALQNFSAQNSGEISVVVTRNIKDYKTSTLSVMKPAVFLKTLNEK